MTMLLVDQQTFNQLNHVLKTNDKKDVLIRHLKSKLNSRDKWEFHDKLNDLTVEEMEHAFKHGFKIKNNLRKLPKSFFFRNRFSDITYMAIAYEKSVYVAWKNDEAEYSERYNYENILKDFKDEMYYFTDVFGNKLEMEQENEKI